MAHKAKVSPTSGRTTILTTTAHISVTRTATSCAFAATIQSPGDCLVASWPDSEAPTAGPAGPLTEGDLPCRRSELHGSFLPQAAAPRLVSRLFPRTPSASL